MDAIEEDWDNSKTTNVRAVRYVITQLPQWFSELTFFGGLHIILLRLVYLFGIINNKNKKIS